MAHRRIAEAATQAAPHSWDLEHWPPHVYPHTAERARYIVRTLKTELIAEGALSRVGRELVFNGVGYTRWLQTRQAAAAKFDVVANRMRLSALART